MVAERMAFLDHLTHGRLIYGFGGGGLVSDKLFFQVGDEASPRMREALDIIELLFSTTDYVDFAGKFWQLDHKRIQVRPYQEHPQFSIAGMSGTHNFELCGERGYAALSIYFTPVQIEDNPGMPDLIAQGNAIVKAAEAAGRDPAAARERLADLPRGLRVGLEERGDGGDPREPRSSRTTTCSRSGWRR